MKYTLSVVCCLLLSSVTFAFAPKDSIGLTKVNGKSVIVHKVSKGEGLLSIAKRYNTSVDDIKKLNPSLKIPSIGQKLNIPYTVTLSKAIIDSTKITVDESHANADSKEVSIERKHIVSQGETIPKIATKYKITQQQLVKWNNIKNNAITVGQELKVTGTTNIKSYEKWNQPNSTSIKVDTPKNILSPTTNQIEETGLFMITEKVTHPSLPIGSLILCTNPESNKQVLLKIEQNNILQNGIVVGIPQQSSVVLQLKSNSSIITIKYNQP